MTSIAINRSSVYALRKELQAKDWAKFDGDHVTALYGFDSPKKQTSNEESRDFNVSADASESENSDSPENQTAKSRNSDSPVQKIRLVSPKIQTIQSKNSDSHIRNNQQIEPAKEPAKNTSAKPKQPDDPLFAIFAERFHQAFDCPYLHKDADFVHIAKLRKTCRSKEWELTEGRIRQAVNHYFASDIGNPTLADLCVRFSAFYKAALDRFGKAISNGNGTNAQRNGFQSKSEQVYQHNMALIEQMDRERQAATDFVDMEVNYA